MKKRPALSLDAKVVHEDELKSYQINTNKSLRFRAFLFNETGMYTKDGRQLPTTVKRTDIDFSEQRNVGSGASGVVFFARLKDKTPIALKHIRLSSRSHRDEIERELQYLFVRSNCPYVTSNYGAFWDAENDAIVIPMEWMPYSVKDISDVMMGFDESLVRDVFFQIVSGLCYLHDVQHVIHRDLKPSNLLVKEDGHVKIADFGVSKMIHTLQVSSTYVGTQSYMAPERLDTGDYGYSSDVWSLGLTMIAAATAKNPWGSDSLTIFQLLGKMRSDETPELPKERNFSPALRDLIAQCLHRDPKDRPTCAELLLHPFFAGVTEESATEGVRMAVQLMTVHINAQAKKEQDLEKSQKTMEDDVKAMLDKIAK